MSRLRADRVWLPMRESSFWIVRENVYDFDCFAAYSIDNSVWSFHQFANVRSLVPVNRPAQLRKCRQVVTALQNTVDRTVRGIL